MTDDPTQKLDDLITTIQDDLAGMTPGTEEYTNRLKHLEKLYELRGTHTPRSHKPISREKMLEVAGSLLGVLIIVGYERGHVMTSKALGQIIRIR